MFSLRRCFLAREVSPTAMKVAQRSVQFASNRAISWTSRVLVTWHVNTAKFFQHLSIPCLLTLRVECNLCIIYMQLIRICIIYIYTILYLHVRYDPRRIHILLEILPSVPHLEYKYSTQPHHGGSFDIPKLHARPTPRVGQKQDGQK